MSTVTKMEIHGIRSFGLLSSDAQVQKISFHDPLTLIVGQNGCGKTTIIECLKYGLTGELPPNSDKGKSFVHNTKMAAASEAIGKVKLQVKDIRGDKTTIDRSHKVVVKKIGDVPQASTMGTTITFESHDGKKKVSLTRRKEDATADMCQAMGVSRAIVNNVIFCHQEESNWPLDIGSQVKKNFDDIFGTTEYNNLLDDLKKKMKTRDDTRKLKQEELKLKQHVKSQADQMNEKLKRCEQAIIKNNGELAAIEEKLKPIRERIIEIAKRESKGSEIYKQEIQLKEKIQANVNNQRSYKQRIKSLFDGDISALNQEIRDFQSNASKIKDEYETATDRISILKQNYDQNEQKLRQLERDKIQLQQQIQQQQEKISERAKFLQDIGPKVGVSVSIDIENESNNIVQDIISRIRDKVKSKDETLNKLKETHVQMERMTQDKVDAARDKKTKIDTSITAKVREIKNHETEVDGLQSKINAIESSGTKLKEIVQKISQIETELERFDSQTHFSQMETNITGYKTQRDTIQQELDTLDDKIDQLSQVSNTLNEVSYKTKQLTTIEGDYKRIMNKHAENLKRIFPNKTLERDFKREVQQRYDQLVSMVKGMNDSMNQKQNDLVKTQTKHQHLRTSLIEKENELKRGEEDIYRHCQSDDFEEVKAKAKEKVEKFQMELGANRASETLFKKYIKDLSDRSCCPLCHNEMSGLGKDDLIEELTGKIHTLPEKITQQEHQLQREKEKLHDLLALGPTIERVKKLRDETTTLKQEIRQLDEKIKETESEIEDVELCIATPDEDKYIANNMLSDMSSLDRFKFDMEKLQTEIQTLKQRIPAGQADENLEELKKKKKSMQDELRELRAKIDQAQKQIDDQQRKLKQLQDNRNKLLEVKYKLQENYQTLPQQKERLEQLKKMIETTRQEVVQLNRDLDVAKDEWKRVEDEKERERLKNKSILDKATEEKQKVDQLFRDIQRCNEEITQYEELNLQAQENKLRENYMRRGAEQQKLSQTLKTLEEKLTTLKDTITKQEIRERDLQENLYLKKAEQECDELKKQLEVLQLNLGELDFSKLSRDKDRLQKQEDELVAKRSNIRGVLSKEEEQVNEYRAELNKPQFKNAYRAYIKLFHEVKLLELIVNDIKNYRAALDVAITKYHQEKMAQINQSIRGLWQEIYRGNDIDYIEIRTDSAESKGNRRNLNYRVIQVKKSIELDMRGRCSAGQKVLASLVIRMALAETFSANCAIMALDEPTTNLDHENITSLCQAIGKIIQDQQNYGHFTWIIITHDETFLDTLAPYIEASYRVSRNHGGRSIITKLK